VERLQADAERIARQSRTEQPGAAGKVGQAAQAIQDTRVHDRILYSKDVMRGNSPEYSRRFEEQISDNLGTIADRLREASGAIAESAEGKRDRALERARELVQGLESLRDRTGRRDSAGDTSGQGGGERSGGQSPGQTGGRAESPGQGQGQGQGQAQGQGQGQEGGQAGPTGGQGSGGRTGGRETPGGPANGNPSGGGGVGRVGGFDPNAVRQFSREFRLRREAAESLRRELGQVPGLELGELDRAISDLRRLESGRAFADPKGLADLQAAVIEGLKTWEFRLFRALGQTGENRPALGAPSQAPAEYRALVEEYYRSLGRPKPKP
jgi:hypothetical protein